MKVQCTNPGCLGWNEYAPGVDASGKQTAIRKRKICTHCGTRFEVKAIAPVTVGQQAGSAGGLSPGLDIQDPRLVSLPQFDIDILHGLKAGESQASIARDKGVSRAAIAQHVKKMIDGHVLVENPTWPRSYEILPEISKTMDDPAIMILRAHKVDVRFDRLAKLPGYDDFLKLCKHVNMNWDQYRFVYKYVNFQISETKTPNVFCHVTAAGRTSQEIEQNAWEKALQLQDWIQDHAHVVLALPAINIDESEITLQYTSKQGFDVYKETYNDKSDPAAILETKTRLAREKGLDMIPDAINNQKEIRAEQQAMKAELGTLKRNNGEASEDVKQAIGGFEKRMDLYDKRMDASEARDLRIESLLARIVGVLEHAASQ
jgi:hypothetical protein